MSDYTIVKGKYTDNLEFTVSAKPGAQFAIRDNTFVLDDPANSATHVFPLRNVKHMTILALPLDKLGPSGSSSAVAPASAAVTAKEPVLDETTECQGQG